MTDAASTKTVKTSGKDAHLAACAAAKVQGDARRAAKKAERATAHRALLDGRRDEAAKAKAERIAGHEARNEAEAVAAHAREEGKSKKMLDAFFAAPKGEQIVAANAAGEDFDQAA